MRSLLRSLVVVAVLLVAGCSAGGGGEATSADGGAAYEGGGATDSGGGVPGAGEDSAGGEAPGAPSSDGDEQFVTSGSVSMLVESPQESAAEAARLVESAGGHVQERVEQGAPGDESATAYLVVRIPSDAVTDTLDRLKDLGEVQDATLMSTEVTDEVKDLDAKVRALKISISRLEDLLNRAGSIPDIVEAERVLTDRQSELEVLLSQQAALADDVAMSTFRIDMFTKASEPEPEPQPATGFWAGFVAGWNALIATLNGLLQVVGALLPWLAFAALVTAAVVATTRWFQRRKASTAPPSAPHPFEYGEAPRRPGPGRGPTTTLRRDAGPVAVTPHDAGPVPPAPPVMGPVAPPQPDTTAPLPPVEPR